jgi:biopolymer transport protein TolR
MVLKILKDRTVHLNQDPIRVNDVKEKLVNVMKARRDKTLFVRADRDVPYGFVAYVIGEVRAAGISKLGLVTQPLDGGSPNEHR